jgi:peptide deformylase
MRLKIIHAGEPVLRKVARELSRREIGSASVQRLIECMRETVRDAPGVGLAAPQIGESLQVAVIEDKIDYQKLLSRSELKERGRRPIPFHVIANPRIELLTEPTEIFFEACLSLPGFTALVPRSKTSTLSPFRARSSDPPWHPVAQTRPASRGSA